MTRTRPIRINPDDRRLAREAVVRAALLALRCGSFPIEPQPPATAVSPSALAQWASLKRLGEAAIVVLRQDEAEAIR